MCKFQLTKVTGIFVILCLSICICWIDIKENVFNFMSINIFNVCTNISFIDTPKQNDISISLTINVRVMARENPIDVTTVFKS